MRLDSGRTPPIDVRGHDCAPIGTTEADAAPRIPRESSLLLTLLLSVALWLLIWVVMAALVR